MSPRYSTTRGTDSTSTLCAYSSKTADVAPLAAASAKGLSAAAGLTRVTSAITKLQNIGPGLASRLLPGSFKLDFDIPRIGDDIADAARTIDAPSNPNLITRADTDGNPGAATRVDSDTNPVATRADADSNPSAARADTDGNPAPATRTDGDGNSSATRETPDTASKPDTGNQGTDTPSTKPDNPAAVTRADSDSSSSTTREASDAAGKADTSTTPEARPHDTGHADSGHPANKSETSSQGADTTSAKPDNPAAVTRADSDGNPSASRGTGDSASKPDNGDQAEARPRDTDNSSDTGKTEPEHGSAQAIDDQGPAAGTNIDGGAEPTSNHLHAGGSSDGPTTAVHDATPDPRIREGDLTSARGTTVDTNALVRAVDGDRLPRALDMESVVDNKTLFGVGPDGTPNNFGDFRRHHMVDAPNGNGLDFDWPANNGAVPGSTRSATVADYQAVFKEDVFTRAGHPGGAFGAPINRGQYYTFDQASLRPGTLFDEFHHYKFTPNADDILSTRGWSMKIEQVAPGLGRPGGGMQMRWVDKAGENISIEELMRRGVIEEVVLR